MAFKGELNKMAAVAASVHAFESKVARLERNKQETIKEIEAHIAIGKKLLSKELETEVYRAAQSGQTSFELVRCYAGWISDSSQKSLPSSDHCSSFVAKFVEWRGMPLEHTPINDYSGTSTISVSSAK